MTDATREMALFLLVATIALAAAEYTTRRSLEENVQVRWLILAGVWLVLAAMLLFVVNA